MVAIYFKLKECVEHFAQHIAIRSIIIIAIALLTVNCHPPPEAASSGKVIKIGVIGPLDYAAGKKVVEGIKTAQLIEPLTKNGDKIEFVIIDDKLDSDLTVKQYEKLAKTEDFKAVIMLSPSNALLPVSFVSNQLKLPVINTIATHQDVTTNNKYISRVCFSDDRQANVAAIFVRDELLIDKVAIIYDDQDTYSENMKNVFRKMFITVGGEIIAVLPVKQLSENLMPLLVDLKDAGVQLIYMVVNLSKTIEVLEGLDELNWNVGKMGADGLLERISFKAKDRLKLFDGLITTDHVSTDAHLTEIGRIGRKVYIEHFGVPGAYTVLGFEAFFLLKHALDVCGPAPSRECISVNIRNVNLFEGVFGQFSIENGNALRPVMINEMKNGKMNLIVKVY